MIIAEFKQDAAGHILEYEIRGHAEFADPGYDIICAAVSVLAVNTANSLEVLTGIPIEVQEGEDGFLRCVPSNALRDNVQLLLQSLRLGLESICEAYGNQFLKLQFVSAPSSLDEKEKI